MHKPISSIPALSEDAIIRLFGDAGRARESSPDMELISVIGTVVTIDLVKGF